MQKYTLSLQLFDASILDWQTLSYFVSLISIILLIFTMIEMIRQRRESYRPKLLIKTESIQIETNNKNIPTVWRNPTNKDKRTEGYFDLRVYNIGLGPATDIQIKWEIPKQKIIKKFKDYSPVLNNNNKLRYVTTKGSLEYELFQEDDLSIRKESFLMNNDFFYISLPTSIFYYFSIISHYISKKSNYGERIELDPMKLELSYFDIGKKKIQERMTLDTEFISMYNDDGRENDQVIAIGDIHVINDT
ncbi:hypothetical protein EXM22_01900 [Oceanispirochaeta crateris]|uniref:Uncharacterized protein n=1 Tax=Oceanispirochaeta crateris TaxID=2518645 RepID=A0A5C1QFA7_9SPIO|nr:hypothetical protein [Oceanispirochaeta crateris]QEN06803.1 hypothetical protein EXM22_01900 [Oceanispirochaeta crateris]